MNTLPKSLLKPKALAIALSAALATLAACGGGSDPAPTAATPTVTLASVEFTDTPVPSSEDAMLKTFSSSTAVFKYSDGSSKTYPLSYTSMYKNTDVINEAKGVKYAAAQVFDVNMNPVKDPNGDPVVAETADANSLLKVGNKLMLVTQWEYDNILADGQKAYKVTDWYSRMPMGMNLSEVSQASDGKLSVKNQKAVDFSSVNGGWIFCAGSQTPWNTHLAAKRTMTCTSYPVKKATPPQRPA